jgi:hypothetical protein
VMQQVLHSTAVSTAQQQGQMSWGPQGSFYPEVMQHLHSAAVMRTAALPFSSRVRASRRMLHSGSRQCLSAARHLVVVPTGMDWQQDVQHRDAAQSAGKVSAGLCSLAWSRVVWSARAVMTIAVKVPGPVAKPRCLKAVLRLSN